MADRPQLTLEQCLRGKALWLRSLEGALECKNLLEQKLGSPFHVVGILDAGPRFDTASFAYLLQEGLDNRCKENGAFDDYVAIFSLDNETDAKQCAESLKRLHNQDYQAFFVNARILFGNVWTVKLSEKK